MKKAIEAKMTGWRTDTSTKKSEFVRVFMWKSQPIQKSLNDTGPRYRWRGAAGGTDNRRLPCSTASPGSVPLALGEPAEGEQSDERDDDPDPDAPDDRQHDADDHEDPAEPDAEDTAVGRSVRHLRSSRSNGALRSIPGTAPGQPPRDERSKARPPGYTWRDPESRGATV